MTTRDSATSQTPDPTLDPSAVLARRELVVAAVVMVALTRAVESADAFLIAGLLPVVMLAAGVGVLRIGTAGTRPFEALLIPHAHGRGRSGDPPRADRPRARADPVGFAILLDRILVLELRLQGHRRVTKSTAHGWCSRPS